MTDFWIKFIIFWIIFVIVLFRGVGWMNKKGLEQYVRRKKEYDQQKKKEFNDRNRF